MLEVPSHNREVSQRQNSRIMHNVDRPQSSDEPIVISDESILLSDESILISDESILISDDSNDSVQVIHINYFQLISGVCYC